MRVNVEMMQEYRLNSPAASQGFDNIAAGSAAQRLVPLVHIDFLGFFCNTSTENSDYFIRGLLRADIQFTAMLSYHLSLTVPD